MPKMLLSLLMFLQMSFSLAHAADLVWTTQTAAGYIDTSPATGDINGDGRKEIVVVTTVGSIIAMDSESSEIWRYETRDILSTPPTIADVSAGPELEVLVLANSGRIFCLEGAGGSVLWQSNLPGLVDWGRAGIVAADLDGDGACELVAADSLETLSCFSGNGKLLWTHKHPGIFNTYPAVADINGDGKQEILLGAMDSPLVCVSHDGKELWRLHSEGAQGASPLIADLTGDGRPEILVGIGNDLAAVDNAGKILWTYPMRQEVDCAVTVADADGDGKPEIFAADLAGKFVCLSPDGGLMWEADLEQRVRRSPSVADIDGDGTQEILIAGYSKKLYVFDPRGLLEETIPLDGEINATPTVVDFAGDGRLAVVCPVASGKMHLFQWPQERPNASTLVSEFRVTSARAAAPAPAKKNSGLSVARFDSGNCYAGSNAFEVDIRNPEKSPVAVELSVLRDDAKVSATSLTSVDEHIHLRLLYTVDAAAPARFTFNCAVSTEERDAVLVQRRQDAYVVPFMKEFADIGRLADEIRAAIPNIKETTTPQLFLFRLEAELPQMKDRAALAGTLTGSRRTNLINEFTALRMDAARMAAMVRAAATAESTLVAYAANPWAPFGKADELAEGRLNSAQVNIEAFAGETESAAINVFNFSDRTRTLRVDIDPIKLQDQPKHAISVREALDVPTQMLDYSADALPALNEARTIIVPPWDARQLWLTVDTAALAPGEWQGRVRLRALDVQSVEAAAPVTVTVWDAALPTEQKLSLCHWGYVHTSILKDSPDAALDDQVAHRTNVFVGTIYPKAVCDETGAIIGDIDFTAHDEYVRKHSPHGIILFCGYQGALTGAPHLSPEWVTAHKEYLRAWVRHLAELGVGYDKFALYPIDEPGLSPGLADKFVEYAKIANEADPKILFYTDPVGSVTMDELRAMAPYVDIWCPNRGGFLIKHNGDKLDFIKSTGARVWTYECEANAKHQSPLGYYRGQAWLAWDHGLTGIGFWSYCTSKDDPWYTADKEYLLIYQGNGVVPSKRWEAIRDGIEDYAMLAQLRDAADKAKAEARAPEAVAAAQTLLKDQAAKIADFCGRDDDGTVPGSSGLSGDRDCTDQRWTTIQQTRRNIADLLQKLK